MAHRLSSCSAQLYSTGSTVVEHNFSCSAAHGIFLEEGSNLCPCLGGWILIHCTTKEVKKKNFFLSIKNAWEIHAIISQF